MCVVSLRIGPFLLATIAVLGIRCFVPAPAHAAASPGGRIVTYAVPSGQPVGTNFTVQVRTPGGPWTSVETYLAEVNYYEPADASMAEFDASGPVQVAVTSLSGAMQTARVRPFAAGITPTLSADGTTATFTLAHPMDVSFEANGDTQHNLQVFVNQIEPTTSKPLKCLKRSKPKSEKRSRSKKTAGSKKATSSKQRTRPKKTTRCLKRATPKPTPPLHVISFGPGIHEIPGEHVLNVPSDTNVEIAGGAIVEGILNITGSHVTVEGHGVIDPSRFFSVSNNPPTVLVHGASDVGIRNVTILDSQSVGFEVEQSDDVVISHVREINSVRYSDGIDVAASHGVLIENSFLRTSDDSIAVFASTPYGASGSTSDVTVRNCTLFPDVAHPVLVGTFGNPAGGDQIQNLLFENLDILEEDVQNPVYQGVLAVDAGDNTAVSDLQFEDVNVEHITEGQLFNVRVFLNPDLNQTPGAGVSDILFRNVNFPGANDAPSQIEGYEPTRAVSGVTFENLTRDGQPVLEPAAGNIDIGANASSIVFRPTASIASVDDNAASLRYSGPWMRAHATGYFDGTAHIGSSSSSSASFTFQGTQARLYGTLSSMGGMATVQVDGDPPVTIDTYAESTSTQQLWFDTGVLPEGTHTIQIRASGAGDPLSSGTSIGLDRVDVVP
jgi:hypothetical protein